MASGYPASIDSLATNKTDATAMATDHAGHHNDLADAVNKIETELGTNPKGSSATVKARLDTLATKASPTFTGVVTVAAGTAAAPSIVPTGDTDTGIFAPAANTLAISNGGTERLRIDSAGLITGSGTSLGAFTSWTPTLGGTWAVGNGILDARYCRIGRQVAFRISFLFGTTSTASGILSFTLPVTARIGGGWLVNCELYDASVGLYIGSARFDTTTTVTPIGLNASNQPVFLQTTTPFTWTNPDSLVLSGTYEAA